MKMRGQMWYLSEDLIGLALFSDFVPNSENEALIAALKIPPIKTDPRRVYSKLVANFQEKNFVVRKFTVLSAFFLQL